MHELSLCQGLIRQVCRLGAEQQARGISRISLAIGPLAGVEIGQLQHAFPFSSRHTLAEGAELNIEETALRVRCTGCGAESDASLNQLSCRHCGEWRTQLISGDEMLLINVEFIL